MRIVFYTYPDHFGSNVITLDQPAAGFEGEVALHIDEEDLKYDTYAVDLILETGQTEVSKSKSPYNLTITDEYVSLIGPFRNQNSAITWVKHIHRKMVEWEEAYDESNDLDDRDEVVPRTHEEDN